MTFKLLFSHIFLFVILGITAGCDRNSSQQQSGKTKAEPAPALLRLHFVGTEKLASDTNAAPWFEMAVLPESQALWRQTKEKLATAPYRVFREHIASTNSFAEVFQEIISDLVRAESVFELDSNSNGISGCRLEIRLPAERVGFWKSNLLTTLETWFGTHGDSISNRNEGWYVKFFGKDLEASFTQTKDSVVFSFGRDIANFHGSNDRATRKVWTNSGKAWLSISLTGAKLAALFEFPLLDNVSGINLEVIGRNSNLRADGRIFLVDSVQTPSPWNIPTNLIHDPISSFTAARDVEKLFAIISRELDFPVKSLPSQTFVWGGANFPFQTLAAFPVTNSSATLHEIGSLLMEKFNGDLATHDAGVLMMTTNWSGTEALRWTGIPPFVLPHITAEKTPNGDFLLGGVHLNWAGTNPPPPAALFNHLVSSTNLIYYDWEITAERFWAWRNMVNVFRHIFESPRLSPDTASIQWMNSISNRLSNTVTELQVADSKEIILIRQGPVCLTGPELITLVHWLESPDFPLIGEAFKKN